jgi:hypothetical protein
MNEMTREQMIRLMDDTIAEMQEFFGADEPEPPRGVPRVPPHIEVAPLEGSRPTRMRPTNERGEPIDADPFPVRWCERLRAYVRADELTGNTRTG